MAGSTRSEQGPTTAHRPLPRRVVLTGNVAAPPPPARPAVTSDIAPPLPRSRPPRPATVRAAVALWWAGCLAAVTGISAALLDLGALRDRLAVLATAEDPAAPADLVTDGVRATIALVLGGVGALVAVSLVWTALVLRGSGWARWALVLTVVPAVLVLDVAQTVVTGGADLDRWALVAAAVLCVLAVVPLFSRSARAAGRR
ncbi:hypothetical protein SAMN05660642_03444 [Geodermatophilus siccatus]|uniref:Uncharacterized protein n=1 Tax=Geodermatophilus siccatus TaxID=1137991 RepID=A0A1G9WMJ6_9ACTN|nr:hypothetical protein [Geodermatophilus siccatus]SDM85376.1 hypothetical protein SAMN05660642_03444 [Geodermatophilus siccatus]